MPTYTFRNKTTGEEWTDMMSIAEMETLLKDENVEQVIVAVHIGDPWSRKKMPSGFREVLKKIKKNNRGAKIDTGNISSI